MTGRCVVISINFFRDCCHLGLCLQNYLVLLYVLGYSGYLTIMHVVLLVSCCCDMDHVVFL